MKSRVNLDDEKQTITQEEICRDGSKRKEIKDGLEKREEGMKLKERKTIMDSFTNVIFFCVQPTLIK